MKMKNSETLLQWQEARLLFEKYIDKPITQSVSEINESKTIDNDIKIILLKLVKSQRQDDTLIAEANLSLFNVLKNTQEDLSGQSIMGYKLVEKIGQGGMSCVYKAKRKDAKIQKFAALKLLTYVAEELSEQLKELFTQEQLTLSKLNHPNIISFYHGGLSQNGIPFLVMEYIDNAITIKDYVLDNELSNKKIIKLAIKIADGINYAHQNLIIHKDIKPSNILIDGHNNPKIVDFGIASFTYKNVKLNTKESNIFTPDYASPEQIKNQKIYTNSDVFSLTAVLLELLTKQKPLPKIDVNNYNPKNDENHVQTLLKNTPLHQDLKNIIKKGLASESSQRYQSMQALKDDLENWLLNKPVSATKNSLIYVTKKFIQRHKAVTFVTVSLFASISLGLIFALQQWNKAQNEALKSQQVTQFLVESIQASDPDLTKGKQVSVVELLQNAKLKIQESTFKDDQLKSALKQTIGSALIKVGQYDDAESMLKQILAQDQNNNDARLKLAQLYIQQKQFKKAQDEISVLSNHLPKLSQAHLNGVNQVKSLIFLQKGEFKKAKISIQKVLEAQEKSINNKEVIKSLIILTTILDESGQYELAVDTLQHALKISNEIYGELSTSSTDISLKLAGLLVSVNPIPWKQVMTLYEVTISRMEKLYGKNHPKVAQSYLKFGFILKTNGEFEQALFYANKAQEIALLNFGPDHILTAHTNILISMLNLKNNEIAEAIKQLENALNVYETYYGKDHYETNQTQTTLAAYYIIAKQGDKALKMLLPLLDQQTKQLGSTNKATFYVKLNILKAYNLDEKYEVAIEKGEKYLAMSKKHLGNEQIMTIGIEFTLANSYKKSNNLKKSLSLTQELLGIDFVKNNPGFHKKIALFSYRKFDCIQPKK